MAGVVAAQPLAPSAADPLILEGLRRQEESRQRERRALEFAPSELRPPERAGPAGPPPVETDCHPVREVELAGPDAARFTWLLQMARTRPPACLGGQGLARLAHELDQALQAAGFATTRVAYPAQDLASGRLLLQLHAGRVARIELLDGPDAADGWGTWRNAFPLATGDLMNTRDLEHGVENMKRLPSQSVRVRVEPGERPDTSDLFIEREPATWRQRLRGGLRLDNGGGPVLGRTLAAGHGAWDNPLGLNDILAFSFQTPVERPGPERRSQAGSVQYSVPWGYGLWTLEAGRNRFAQPMPLHTVAIGGESETGELRLQHTAWRSASSRLDLLAAVSARRSRGWVGDQEVVAQRRRSTSASAGLRYRQLFGTGALDAELGLRHVVSARQASPELAASEGGGARLRPGVWSAALGWQQDLRRGAQPWTVQSSLRLQATRQTTLAIDQFAIGGRYTVRGFDGDAVLLAESGLAWRNEASTFLGTWGNARWAGVLALDYGRIWGESAATQPGRQLAGTAAGVRATRAGLAFEAMAATPLTRPAGFPARPLVLYAFVSQAL
nr:ShlB/FhaC/HecB family hemolysin secretion/activation protein [Ramlibacter aurantiacus]